MAKKYFLHIIIISLFLFTWAEEIILGEGDLHYYFYLPEHKWLRFFIRCFYAIIILSLEYIGLSYFPAKWIKSLWILWFGLAIIISGFNAIMYGCQNHDLNNSLWNFITQFYSLSLNPFPYFFIYILYLFFVGFKSKVN